ncbi:MAG: FHA domain-containing protein [Kofleriaceae bacterium]
MPKAQASSSFGDDEEKTTIEHGWEEEPSTTVEEGEVADKIRALGLRKQITGITNTNGGPLDEPTVDDQRANVAIAMLTPVSISMHARLVITAGNDLGQSLDVTPGKTYTVGRGVDNDFVLTDIAVSRKHFDLKFDGGVWVLADRGSGNGTVVNGQIEDNPFSLANGDTIEIGNTQFRIDIPNGPARIARASMDLPVDEDEPSTVASKPLREDTPDPSPPVVTPLGHGPRERPKTVPPPPPMRARTQSQVPAMSSAPPPMHLGSTMPPGFEPMAAQNNYAMPVQTPMRGSGVGPALAPLPPPAPGAMQSRPPMSPTMLGDAMGMPLGPGQMQGGLPATTIPGQGPPLAPSQLPPDMFGYPSSQQMPRQHAPGPNGHVIINGVAVRDATSTALVPPTPYNGMPQVMMPQPAYPLISRRMKLILGGAALTVLAAIATIAIIKGGSNKQEAASAPPPESNKTVTPIEDKKPAPTTAPKTETATKVDAAKVEAKATVPTTPTVAPKVETKPELKTATTVEQPKVETKAEAKKTEPSIDTKSVALDEPKKTETKKTEPKKTETKKTEPKKTEPKKTEKKTERKKVTRSEPKPDPVPETKVERKKVAFDASGAKNKADEQYRAKQFSAAAATLRAAAKNAGDEARELNSLAAVYQQFGAAYNVGMAPGTQAKEAFERLKKALSLDNSAGKAFTDDISGQLAKIAPKAAVSFMGAKDYVKAREAVRVAEANGGGNDTTKEVRKALERQAGTVYKEAMAMLSSDPAGAKDKLKQIRGMVDASSSWAAKAQAQLNKM